MTVKASAAAGDNASGSAQGPTPLAAGPGPLTTLPRTEYIVVPDEDQFTKKADQITGCGAMLRFLDQYLK